MESKFFPLRVTLSLQVMQLAQSPSNAVSTAELKFKINLWTLKESMKKNCKISGKIREFGNGR